MAKRRIVTVYEDPITRCKEEGQAVLLAVHSKPDDGLVRCAVRFIEDTDPDAVVERLVGVDQLS